jgi:Bacterial regulatory proteins, luxR family
LVAMGLTDKEVATELGIQEDTVGSYLKLIFRRYEVHSRTALLRRWLADRYLPRRSSAKIFEITLDSPNAKLNSVLHLGATAAQSGNAVPTKVGIVPGEKVCESQHDSSHMRRKIANLLE